MNDEDDLSKSDVAAVRPITADEGGNKNENTENRKANNTILLNKYATTS
jgi:hypothetical protein